LQENSNPDIYRDQKTKLVRKDDKPAYAETATCLRTEVLQHAGVQAGKFQKPKFKKIQTV